METTSESGSSPVTGSVAVGSVLAGRYRLVARVGAGGMATIFRARDETLERDVAVKVLHGHLADDSDLRKRFRTEGRHAAALLHPSIVNVFDQGVADLPYIVMEYVDGPSLRQVLADRGRLTPGQTLAVVEPVCQALVRAHAAGLVHRDVKPENVLVAADGTPKVADFGIARAVAETGHTETGALIGSVHYLAPELVDGQEATPASDQYAVGVLLFELLTGRKPLPADSPMAVAVRHAREDIPAPSKFVSDVSRALDKVVARATATDPAKRYPDLAAFVAALRAAVPGGPCPVAVAASGNGSDRTLVIPAESADTISLSAQQATEERRDKPASRRRRRDRPRRRRRGLVVALSVVLLLALGAGGAFAVWNYVVAPVTAVPELVGLSHDEAAAELEQRGLALAVSDEQHDFDAPRGHVLGQDPAPGAELRRGDTIEVVLSAGRAVVAMPNVTGMDQGEALALLEAGDYRFAVRVDEGFSDDVPAGVVRAQKPDPETEVEQGSDVIVNVSLGIEQVTVPDLSDMDKDAAQEALSEARLRPDFHTEYSDEVPKAGKVIRQSIDPGTEVDKNSVVTVTVSAGPATVKVPKLEGDDVDSAVAKLQDMGLVANVIKQPRPQIGPFRRGAFGRVEVQDPQPGEPIRRGEKVDLYTFSKDAEED